MNDQIRELAEQSRHWAHFGGLAQNPKSSPDVLFEQKFAELIVGHATECVRDVLRDENSDLSYVAATQVQNRIKEFFGVEQ